MLRRCLIILVALSVLTVSLCAEQDSYQQEADRLASLLNWRPGDVVAEIGAKKGQLTLAAAQRV
ncbi:MAG: hypothetical protein WA660_05075, partial [Candidatus Acidiferrales bacterium]